LLVAKSSSLGAQFLHPACRLQKQRAWAMKNG
jgi:hypothetical protein